MSVKRIKSKSEFVVGSFYEYVPIKEEGDLPGRPMIANHLYECVQSDDNYAYLNGPISPLASSLYVTTRGIQVAGWCNLFVFVSPRCEHAFEEVKFFIPSQPPATKTVCKLCDLRKG